MLGTQLVRRFTTTAIRRGHHDKYDGVPGSNLPFSIENRYKLTLMYAVFLASGFSIPFIVWRSRTKPRADN